MKSYAFAAMQENNAVDNSHNLIDLFFIIIAFYFLDVLFRDDLIYIQHIKISLIDMCSVFTSFLLRLYCLQYS